MRAAFYKGTHAGLPGLYNRLVRWWCSGKYSHAELIFSDGMAASASWMDDGVRFKQIDFDPEKWDFIDLPAHLEPAARKWFKDHEDDPYDVLGNLGFLWRPIRGTRRGRFCSEAVLEALGFDEPWRYDPCAAYCALQFISRPASAGFSFPQ